MGALIRPTLADRPPPVDVETHRGRCRAHAVTRLRQRHAEHFGVVDVLRHERLIRAGGAERVPYASSGGVHRIIDKGHVLYPVFRPELDVIATYLQAPELRDPSRHPFRGRRR